METQFETYIANAIRCAQEHLGAADYLFLCLAFVEDAYEESNHVEIFGGSSARESADGYGAAHANPVRSSPIQAESPLDPGTRLLSNSSAALAVCTGRRLETTPWERRGRKFTRQVVNLRIKGAGKFWLVEHAEIMLQARCQWVAGRWEHFCDSILTAHLCPT